MEKQKFMVVSYDDDQQQGFWDVVVAKDRHEAGVLADQIRGEYASVVDVLTVEELRQTAQNMAMGTVERAERDYQEQLGEVIAEEVEEDLALHEWAEKEGRG